MNKIKQKKKNNNNNKHLLSQLQLFEYNEFINIMFGLLQFIFIHVYCKTITQDAESPNLNKKKLY